VTKTEIVLDPALWFNADTKGNQYLRSLFHIVSRSTTMQGSESTAAKTEAPPRDYGTVDESQAYRPDCPGKMICPITDELICIDRCPLGEEQGQETAAPSCCQTAN
jgi:hypothetical protein